MGAVEALAGHLFDDRFGGGRDLAFTRLGRDEDPSFTVRTMIIGAAWPGATVEETLEQVTERLERTLQESHNFGQIRSYTTAGQTTIFVDLDETTPLEDVADVWYTVQEGHRRHAADAAARRHRAVLQR